MNIEIRLRSLEAKQSAKNGVFLVEAFSNGVASYLTPKGKRKVFDSVDAATAELNKKYDNPVIIIIDFKKEYKQ